MYVLRDNKEVSVVPRGFPAPVKNGEDQDVVGTGQNYRPSVAFRAGASLWLLYAVCFLVLWEQKPSLGMTGLTATARKDTVTFALLSMSQPQLSNINS